MNRPPARIDAANTALFLDVDGTLLDFADHPGDVSADDGLKRLLAGVCNSVDGALALVSGRTILALDRIFAPLRLPAAGAHGAELRFGGAAAEPTVAQRLPGRILDALEEFAGEHDGVLVEPKPGGVSLHYRRAPHLEPQCRRLVRSLVGTGMQEFRVIDGNMVLEIAPAGANKGDAILALLQAAAFVGRRPVFIGDDVTDEDGFHAVNALGGYSIRVGERPGSAARYVVRDTRAVRHWLGDAFGVTEKSDRENVR